MSKLGVSDLLTSAIYLYPGSRDPFLKYLVYGKNRVRGLEKQIKDNLVKIFWVYLCSCFLNYFLWF